MNYKASQELVDLLLRNGFTDYTYKHYPMHWDRLQAGQAYNPNTMNRAFGFLSYTIQIVNQRITAKRGNNHIYFSTLTISERQILSVKFYESLSAQDRTYFTTHLHQSPFGIADFLYRSMLYLDVEPEKFRQKIIFFKQKLDSIQLQ